MNAKRHALHARQLIRACGGINEAAAACRLEKSRLYEFCTSRPRPPGQLPAFMPADVLNDLEHYCGEPVYSRALQADRPFAEEHDGLAAEVCGTTEAAAGLQQLAREAVEDGRLTHAEGEAIELGLQALEHRLRRTRAAADGVAAFASGLTFGHNGAVAS